MKICVVGAGPAGLYFCKRLLSKIKVPIELFEKRDKIYGLIEEGIAPDMPFLKKGYINEFKELTHHPSLKISTSTPNPNLKGCDYVVWATGAQRDKEIAAFKQLLTPASRIFKWYNSPDTPEEHKNTSFGEKVAIVGCGNVALDLARTLSSTPPQANTDFNSKAKEIKEIHVLCRSSLLNSKFTNTELRNLLENTGKLTVYSTEEPNKDAASYDKRRVEMIKKKINALSDQDARPKLYLYFNTTPLTIKKNNGEIEIETERNRLSVTSAISAIGFESDPTTDKEFKTGWCEGKIGNIEQTRRDSYDLADRIAKLVIQKKR